MSSIESVLIAKEKYDISQFERITVEFRIGGNDRGFNPYKFSSLLGFFFLFFVDIVRKRAFRRSSWSVECRRGYRRREASPWRFLP